MGRWEKILDPKLWLVASLTLGLAPFVNDQGQWEPHLWGKILWIWGGAVGMKLADWLDFLMHGAPWVMLIVSLVYRFRMKAATS